MGMPENAARIDFLDFDIQFCSRLIKLIGFLQVSQPEGRAKFTTHIDVAN
jgi:hypothetical protein